MCSKTYTPLGESKTFMPASPANSSLHGVSSRISDGRIVGIRSHSITEIAFVKLKNIQVTHMLTKDYYQACWSFQKLTKL